MDKEGHGVTATRSEIVFIICEAICILFYGLFTEFDDYDKPTIHTME